MKAIRQLIKQGDGLLESGGALEAGLQFLAAWKLGHKLNKIRRLIAAWEAAKAREPDLVPQLIGETIARQALWSGAAEILYLPIPKNACSAFKVAFAMNVPECRDYAASGKYVHEFLNDARFRPGTPGAWQGVGVHRFTILRNPFDRILSAYLDKLVRHVGTGSIAPYQRDAIAAAQSLLGISADPSRSLSFAEFASYLAASEDACLNVHWLPQFRMCGEDPGLYEHVGLFEKLDATFEYAGRVLNWQVTRDIEAHIPNHGPHRASYVEAGESLNWCDCLPAELRGRASVAPPRQFYCDAVRDKIARRYARDISLYAACAPEWDGLPSAWR